MDDTINRILYDYEDDLSKDFDKYRNHVLRIYNYCLSIDDTPQNREKYAVAAAFHDLGIWTNHTFDYLNPSIKLAKTFLETQNKSEWIEEITLMIDNHHKMTAYLGTYKNTVETFRKADWIDVSLGIKKFGLDRNIIKSMKTMYANKGFHVFLIKMFFKNLLINPFIPLPMFKK